MSSIQVWSVCSFPHVWIQNSFLIKLLNTVVFTRTHLVVNTWPNSEPPLNNSQEAISLRDSEMKKLLNFFILILCFSLLVWQSYENIKTYLSHPTAQRMSSKSLIDNGFPKIKICISPGFDTNYLKYLGYSSLANFASGKGQWYNGWNGNRNIDIGKLFENAFLFKNFTSIVASFSLKLGNEDVSDFVNIQERKFRYPDGKCFDFDIKIKTLNSYGTVLILILGFNDANTTITMRITDPHREYFLSDVFYIFWK
jgi:hypothetical protein